MFLDQFAACRWNLITIPGYRKSAVSLPTERALQGTIFHNLPWYPASSLQPRLTEGGWAVESGKPGLET